MPDTPLNPDAVKAARLVYGGLAECEAASDCDECQIEAGQIIRAYLAVAQPEVTSVEELDALPYGSLITGSSGVTVMKYDGPNYDWITGNDYRYRMEEQEQCLPARVLYRPEVKL